MPGCVWQRKSGSWAAALQKAAAENGGTARVCRFAESRQDAGATNSGLLNMMLVGVGGAGKFGVGDGVG